MKKVILMVFGLVLLSASTVMAQYRDRVYVEDDYSYYNANITWGIGLGGAPLGNGFGTNYSAGYGLDGNIGLNIDRSLAVLLVADSYLFNTTNPNVYSGEVNIMPSIRLTFDSPGVRPYVIAGLGLNENIGYFVDRFGNVFSNSTTNFVVGGGFGIAFRVAPRLDIYIQAKYEDVLASGGNFSYFPIDVGVQFN
jgi:hypothetical protein